MDKRSLRCKFVECYNYNLLLSTTTFAGAMIGTCAYISNGKVIIDNPILLTRN